MGGFIRLASEFATVNAALPLQENDQPEEQCEPCQKIGKSVSAGAGSDGFQMARMVAASWF